jgi:hypothetical protein
MNLAVSPGQEPQSWSERAARTLEQAMGHLGTWLVLGLLALAAAVIAGYATHRAGSSPSAWAAGITPFVLGATLLAVLWYSLETRRLVRAQRDAAEITDHPWLHVAGWPVERPLIEGSMGIFRGVEVHLPIQNVGHTPALLRDISVSYEKLAGSRDCEVIRGGDANARVLAPGQQFVTKVAEVRFGEAAPPTLYLDVSISYGTIHGGTGRLVLRFRYADRAWKSRDTDYACTLSSRVTLPRPMDRAADRG